MAERIAEVGYINPECEHAMFSIYEPALLNPGADWVQVVVTINGARELKARLDAFLTEHDKRLH